MKSRDPVFELDTDELPEELIYRPELSHEEREATLRGIGCARTCDNGKCRGTNTTTGCG